jgi:hypothetical protein
MQPALLRLIRASGRAFGQMRSARRRRLRQESVGQPNDRHDPVGARRTHETETFVRRCFASPLRHTAVRPCHPLHGCARSVERPVRTRAPPRPASCVRHRNLHDNRFVGWIPTELGTLTAMTELYAPPGFTGLRAAFAPPLLGQPPVLRPRARCAAALRNPPTALRALLALPALTCLYAAM